MVLEDFFDDTRDGHFLGRVVHGRVKDAAIRGAAEKPQPGDDGGLIGVEPLGARKLDERADVTAEKALLFLAAVFRHAPADGDTFAEQLEKIHRRLLAEEFGIHHKRPAQLLGDGDALEQELVLAERRRDGNGTMVLSVCHICQGCSMRGAQSNENAKFPSLTETCTRLMSAPVASRERNSRPISGSMVLVMRASTMRAPRSSSVQRWPISSGTLSSKVNGTLWFSSTRFSTRERLSLIIRCKTSLL